MNKLAGMIEHTLLRADATRSQIETLCAEARANGFFGVCVNGSRVQDAYSLLEETQIQVVTVVGFPLGAMSPDVKRYETEAAVDEGAHEIDMVINIGRLKDGEDRLVLREIRDVVEAADERPVKVIVETALLLPEELERACKLAEEGGAKFVKTSTGYGPRGASVDDIQLIRQWVSPSMGIKASGGIRDAQFAWALVEAGATRLGSSSGALLLKGA